MERHQNAQFLGCGRSCGINSGYLREPSPAAVWNDITIPERADFAPGVRVGRRKKFGRDIASTVATDAVACPRSKWDLSAHSPACQGIAKSDKGPPKAPGGPLR